MTAVKSLMKVRRFIFSRNTVCSSSSSAVLVSAGGGGSGESEPAGHRTAQHFTLARTRVVNITRWLLLVLQIY